MHTCILIITAAPSFVSTVPSTNDRDVNASTVGDEMSEQSTAYTSKAFNVFDENGELQIVYADEEKAMSEINTDTTSDAVGENSSEQVMSYIHMLLVNSSSLQVKSKRGVKKSAKFAFLFMFIFMNDLYIFVYFYFFSRSTSASDDDSSSTDSNIGESSSDDGLESIQETDLTTFSEESNVAEVAENKT